MWKINKLVGQGFVCSMRQWLALPVENSQATGMEYGRPEWRICSADVEDLSSGYQTGKSTDTSSISNLR